MTWALYGLVYAVGIALTVEGLRLLLDPTYRERVFEKSRRDEGPSDGLRWEDFRAMRANTPDRLRWSGWFYLSLGVGFIVALTAGVLAIILD